MNTSRAVAFALILAAIMCLMPSARAYTYIDVDAKSPDQEGHCLDSDLKMEIPVGKTRQRVGRCESATCNTDYSLSVMGCGVIGAGKGYEISPTDYTKPYPECCPKLVKSSDNFV